MLEETCQAIAEIVKRHEVTLALSKAGEEVVWMYGKTNALKKAVREIIHEEYQGASSPLVCKLGSFDLIVISPCTANTTAKIAYGIADSLVSNIAAQALKTGKKVVAVPTDLEKNVDTMIPSGKKIKIQCRKVDLENVKRLEDMENIVVVKKPMDVEKFV